MTTSTSRRPRRSPREVAAEALAVATRRVEKADARQQRANAEADAAQNDYQEALAALEYAEAHPALRTTPEVLVVNE